MVNVTEIQVTVATHLTAFQRTQLSFHLENYSFYAVNLKLFPSFFRGPTFADKNHSIPCRLIWREPMNLVGLREQHWQEKGESQILVIYLFPSIFLRSPMITWCLQNWQPQIFPTRFLTPQNQDTLFKDDNGDEHALMTGVD